MDKADRCKALYWKMEPCIFFSYDILKTYDKLVDI